MLQWLELQQSVHLGIFWLVHVSYHQFCLLFVISYLFHFALVFICLFYLYHLFFGCLCNPYQISKRTMHLTYTFLLRDDVCR